MSLSGIAQSAAIAGAAALITLPVPDVSWGVWAVTAAAVVTMVSGVLERHARAKRDEKRHEWEQEDRRQIKADLLELHRLQTENTVLTKTGVTQTNGRLDKLLAITAESEHAKGVIEGRAAFKAEEFGKP